MNVTSSWSTRWRSRTARAITAGHARRALDRGDVGGSTRDVAQLRLERREIVLSCTSCSPSDGSTCSM